MEAVTPLAAVGSGCCLDLDTPSDALDVRYRGRIGALAAIWINRWITLEVDVEGLASRQLIAVFGAGVCIVAIEGLISKIACRLA